MSADEYPRRRIIVIVVAVLAVVALTAGGVLGAIGLFMPKAADPAVGDGVAYASAQHGYSVVFPGEPTESTQNLPVQGFTIDLVSAVWQEGDVALVANAATFPEELLSDVDGMLQGSVDGAIANVPGAVVTSSSATTLDGIPAIAAEATSTVGDLRVVIAFDVDTQYQLLALGTDAATAEAFFSSFDRG